MKTQPKAFILQNTEIMSPPHVPEIRLHLASEAHDLWLKTEEDLEQIGLPPPFWAFAWAGGQGLARYILDNPDLVRGRKVLDFASGSGLVAIAAKLAGASEVLSADIDPWAASAITLNSELNGVEVDICAEDLIGTSPEAEVILSGDVFYDRELATALTGWFSRLASQGKLVLVGDPGRSYRPAEKLRELAVYQVQVTRALEDSEVKKTTVWKFG